MLLSTACFAALGTANQMAFAEGENFSLPLEGLAIQPQAINQVNDTVDAIRDRLSEVQCGGWNRDVSVGQNLGQYISKVLGVPGREGEPLGNLASGMAKRKTEFSYPDGSQGEVPAQGKSTACKDGKSEETVRFYRNGDPPGTRNATKQNAYPYIQDPHVCLWRGEGFILDPPLTEQVCAEACDRYMNDGRYTFADCKPEHVVKNGAGVWGCSQWSARWVCSDEWVDTGRKNCEVCSGGNCRCPGPGCQITNAGTTFRSFFRKYTVQTGRAKLQEANKDLLASVNAQVQCYGYYNEIDALKTITYEKRDARCVIGNIKTSGEDYNPKKLRMETQKGKGKYTVDNTLPDPLPGARPYDAGNDVWFTKVMGAFSFLKPEQSLSQALLSPEKAKILATVQNTTDQPYMAESTLRAVDDTSSNQVSGYRPFTAWWQKFTSDSQKVFTPPVVRLRLPATWNQPLEQLSPIAITPVVARDRRTESIEIQLQAKDDLAGVVANQLKRALMLEVREEPVSIVVPMGSPVEFRALAQQWEEYRDRRAAGGGAVPGEVTALINQLLAYANRIESVRTVRAQLPLLFGVLLDKQSDFLVGINAWVEQNRQTLLAYMEVARQRAQLQPLWQAVAMEEQRFADTTNFPWCKNDRFTTPIYSLLDPWLPARPDVFGGVPTCGEVPVPPPTPGNPFPNERGGAMPMLCIPAGEQELVYDLSQMRVTTGSIVLPVLKPLQIRIEVPKPPSLDVELTGDVVPKLADLPVLPDIIADFELSIPSAEALTTPRSLPAPVAASVPELASSLIRAQKTLEEMNNTYEKFWKSLEYLDPNEQLSLEDRKPKCGDKTMQPLDCCSWGDKRCSHVESDLVERFTRITARPAVLLKEDFYAAGYSMARIPKAEDKTQLRVEVYANCTPADLTCQPLLPQTESPVDGWQIVFPQRGQNLSLERIRAKARSYMLNPDGTIVGTPSLPLATKPDALYSTFDVPNSFDLRVPKRQ